jgi:hypothetical protein
MAATTRALPSYTDLAKQALIPPIHTFDSYTRAKEFTPLDVPPCRPEVGAFPRGPTDDENDARPLARLVRSVAQHRRTSTRTYVPNAADHDHVHSHQSHSIESGAFEKWLSDRLPPGLGDAIERHAKNGFLRFGLFSDPMGGYYNGDWKALDSLNSYVASALARLLGPGACFVSRRGTPREDHHLSTSRGASDVYQAWIDWSAALGADCPPCDTDLERRVIETELRAPYVFVPVRPVDALKDDGTFANHMIRLGFTMTTSTTTNDE